MESGYQDHPAHQRLTDLLYLHDACQNISLGQTHWATGAAHTLSSNRDLREALPLTAEQHTAIAHYYRDAAARPAKFAFAGLAARAPQPVSDLQATRNVTACQTVVEAVPAILEAVPALLIACARELKAAGRNIASDTFRAQYQYGHFEHEAGLRRLFIEHGQPDVDRYTGGASSSAREIAARRGDADITTLPRNRHLQPASPGSGPV